MAGLIREIREGIKLRKSAMERTCREREERVLEYGRILTDEEHWEIAILGRLRTPEQRNKILLMERESRDKRSHEIKMIVGMFLAVAFITFFFVHLSENPGAPLVESWEIKRR